MQSEMPWIHDNCDFFNIQNQGDTITIRWTNNVYDDFVLMAESYFSCAHTTLTEIVDAGHDNEKCDMWFLAGMYLYRQAIELLSKALIMPIMSNRNQITNAFTQCQHNIKELFSLYLSGTPTPPLNSEEVKWVNSYLNDLEYFDSNSDLFRYPFKNGFLEHYADSFLDVVDMANSFEQCYSILFKCVAQRLNPTKYQDNIDCTASTSFFSFASHGIGNCHIHEFPWSDGFYKQIEGYSNVAAYIFAHPNGLSKEQLFFPIAFLLRNAIELSLKRLLFVRNEVCVPNHIKATKKNSHNLYKDLWLNVKSVIQHYAEERQEDLSQIEIAETYIKKLDTIDKNGDAFRYPVNYGLEYRFSNKTIDLEYVHNWLQGIFTFLDGCHSMLSEIYDWECDMRSEYT